MSQERSCDPFTETPVHQQNVLPPGQSSQPTPQGAAPFRSTGVEYGIPPYNGGAAYAGAGMQSTNYAQGPGLGYPAYSGMAGYGAGYGNMYNGGYAGAYSGGYGVPYANGYAMQRQNATAQLASGARETGAMVLSGMHEAMSRFARVSGLIEEVLRNLHMLFDAIFGLGYSIGAFRQEASLWLAIKTGPVAFVARLLRRASNVWRLLCIFFMSPLAGRFSPVALVLRILGLVPEEDPLGESLAEMWRNSEQALGDGNGNGFGLNPEASEGTGARSVDNSNM